MGERIQTIRCYVIQMECCTVKGKSWIDEDYFHWSNLSDEETKKAAFDKMQELKDRYIDENFRVILREEFETIIDC